MEAIHLTFEEFGDSNNPPLIILHGFFASARNWQGIAEKLARQFHVFVLNQRNHGTSLHSPVMDYPSLSWDLLLFIETQGFAKVSLLGHSMGGKVAMWFALNHPEKVAKLIIADIAPVSYSHSFDSIIVALKGLLLANIQNRKHADELLAIHITEQSNRLFLLQNLELKEGAYQWRINLDFFLNNGVHIASFPDCEHLTPFAKTCLFIAGEQSNFVNEEQVTGLFPKAVFSQITNAGHWLHVQQPEAFLWQIKHFLRD